MNYKPVVIGNQSNGNAGTKACNDAGKARMEIVPRKDYILLPLWPADPLLSQSPKSSPDDGFKPSGDDEKKITEEPGKEGGDSSKDIECSDKEKEDNFNNTNNVNVASINEVNVVGFNDPDFPDRVTKGRKNLWTASKCLELVKQKEDGIFIIQDKYVTEILKKFGFTDVKTLSTHMETQKPLLKDEDGEEVDLCMCNDTMSTQKSQVSCCEKNFLEYADSVMLGGKDLDGSLTTGVVYVNVNAVRRVKMVNGEQQLQALVDGKKIVVTKASVRRDLQLDDEEGTNCLPNATIFEELTRIGAKTTAWNEFSSIMSSIIIYLAINQKFNFSKYIFESMVKNLDNAGKFLMYLRSARIVSSDEASLSDQEDASKQGRKFHDIDADEDITLENVHDDDIMFDVSDLAGEEYCQYNSRLVLATITEDDYYFGSALAKVEELRFKTRGKGILVEEPVKSIKKKDQIRLDEELAFKLQAEEEQEERLAREKVEANVALTEEEMTFKAKIEDGKPKRLKSKSFANIQELFDKAFKRVNTFVDFRTELVEGTEMEESSKKAEESNALDREDLETLWKLVKAKHGYTRPEEGYERVLWGDLKTMFEHHVEDVVWRNL
ncbi:hypothetical protein Tco_1262176 [Tanacetum coccineum]